MSNISIPLSVTKFFGDGAGPNLLVLGGVHGNEPCGTEAIRQIIAEIETGKIKIVAGSVAFVPIVNPKAYSLNTRMGDRDLNRGFHKFTTEEYFEDKAVNFLIKIMEDCDILLDIHSFKTTGDEFIFIGPENNNGTLQPFAHADAELRFAQSLGINKMVYGWLDSYDDFVMKQNVFLDQNPHLTAPRSHRNFGVGTTEYFRSIGKYGVTVECGNHTDPKAIPIAYKAIQGALAHLGLAVESPENTQPFAETYKFSQIIIRHHEHDTFPQPWTLFHPVAKGDVLGIRHTGEKIIAPNDGAIIFSYDDADVGGAWIYYAEITQRGKS